MFVVLVVAFVPQIRDRVLVYLPYHQLVGDRPEKRYSGDPTYHHFQQGPFNIDNDALRRAGSLVPNDATYAIVVRNDDRALAEVRHGARLFLLSALAVYDPRQAGWILTYRSPLPDGIPAERRYALGGGFVLTKVAS